MCKLCKGNDLEKLMQSVYNLKIEELSVHSLLFLPFSNAFMPFVH